MRLELPTETGVQRRFREFCGAVRPLAEFCGLEVEVSAVDDGAVMAQLTAPQFPHVAARSFWVHDDADELDVCIVMRSMTCYVSDFLSRVSVFKGGKGVGIHGL